MDLRDATGQTVSKAKTKKAGKKKETVNPHNLLAAAFLVFLSIADGGRFEVDSTDGTMWEITVTQSNRLPFRFVVFLDAGEPDTIERLSIPGLEVHFNGDDSVPEGLDPAWEAIFTNLVRMEAISERIVNLCKLHKEWPYA